jgi:Cu/Ag efflux protein CusF
MATPVAEHRPHRFTDWSEMSETSHQRSRWLLPAVLVSLTAACASVSATSMQYVGSPHVPPSDPAVIEILRAEPSRPHERLGEVSVTASTRPAPALAEVEEKLRTAASTLGADAVVVVHDALQPVGWYSTGGWWLDRNVYTITGRRLVGVAIKYAQGASGQSPAAAVPDQPGVVYADRTRATATVQAVDRSQRTVTLERADGRTVTLNVPPNARNFDRIEPGDTIRAEYLDAVAVVVRKSDAPAPAGGTSVVRLAPRGEKPAGVVVDTVEMTGRVEAVDLATRRVTLSGPGRVMVIPVDDRVSRLDEVKAGDEVVIRHTQALAIRLDR